MARTRIYNYVFTPGAAAVGTIKLPGRLLLSDLLLISNSQTGAILYNFSDSTKGGAVSFSSTDTSLTEEGATTLTLEVSTVSQSSGDPLQIFVEVPAVTTSPSETFQDPVQKLRVSTPQSIIDTDFEYGIQSIKWEFLGLNNNIPAYYVRTSDSPVIVSTMGAGELLLATTGVTNVTGAGTTTVTVSIASARNIPTGSIVYIFNTTDGNANGVFTVLSGGASVTSFTYTANGTITAGTKFQTTTRVGLTTVSGTNVHFRTTADIGLTGLSVTQGQPINVQETANEALADGSFLVSAVDQEAKIISYEARGVLSASNAFSNAFTAIYTGRFYGELLAGAGIHLIAQTSATAGGVTGAGTTTVTVSTLGPHNLYVGSPIFVNGTTDEAANGPFSIATVPTATTFTYTATGTIAATCISQGATGLFPQGTQIYARPDAYITHRYADGGVAIGVSNNAVGQQAIRQTRRYFRYQSGKGIQFSTACMFKPAFDVSSITGSSNTATVTTEVDHGLAFGATVRIEGITVSSGVDYYSGDWVVASVTSTKSFTYVMTGGTPTDTNPRVTEKCTVITAAGLRTRSGLFDEQNGFFFEYDGTDNILYACRRNSTTQLRGTISVVTGSSRFVGTGTLFNEDLRVGDYVVVKGMSYQVSRIVSATELDVSPPYRAPTPAAISGATGQLLSSAGITASSGSNITTVNTRAAHRLSAGQRIFVYNCALATANGEFTVATTPSATQFTYLAAANSPVTGIVSNYTTVTGNLTAGSNAVANPTPFATGTLGSAQGQILQNGNLDAGTYVQYIAGGGIATGSSSLTISNAGAGYRSNRSFNNVLLRNVSATGTGARATVRTNFSGQISSLTVTVSGTGYAVGTTLTVLPADVGGSGSGLVLTIATISSGTLIMSKAAVSSATTTTIGIEGARVYSQELNVKMTKTVDLKVPSSGWSIDKVDGTGPSGYVINLNKIQMIYIDYQWYGAGYIRFGMRAKVGEVYYCHKFLHNNFLTEAFQRSGNIPARFEVNTIPTRTFLTADLTNIATSMSVNSTVGFPTAGRVLVDQELITYTNKTLTSFTGLTRGVAGGSAAASHTGTLASATGQASVILMTQQCAPTLSHWGVSAIMDGRFDDDVSYIFTTPKQSASAVSPGVATPIISIRIAPSVDTGNPRPYGVRNLLNRMQLKLNSLGLYANAPLLVQVRLNSYSPVFRNDSWLTDSVGSNSLSQVIYHSVDDYVVGGDLVFAYYTDSADPNSFSASAVDLRLVKDLGTSIISGDGVFPDGPEVLTIFVTNLGNSITTTTQVNPVSGQFSVIVSDATDLEPGLVVAGATTAASVATNAKIVSTSVSGANFTLNLSKPNTGTTGGNITFEQTAVVYARLSWTEAQA
jgi:hypothetical protein